MKQLTTFRLEAHTAAAIAAVAETLGLSKTEVVERAVLDMERSLRAKKHPLLQFAGTLGTSEAQTMLKAIHSARSDKN